MTAQSHELAAASPPGGRRNFLLHKLHSLSGVVPVGVFLMEHLWTNASALRGRASFDGAVAEIQAMPFLPAIEIFGIFLPLGFHAAYGIAIAIFGRPNVGRYPFARNWLYFLQRVTGILALVFILCHLWEYRIQKWLFGMGSEAFYGTLSEHLSSTRWGVPWIALGYTAGLAATVFHFANGLWGFTVSWGLVITRRAMRRAAWVFAALGLGLFLTGFETVLHFATGSAPLLPQAHERIVVPDAPCPPGEADPKESPRKP